MRIRTNPLAPGGGASMDCIFDRLYLTLTWSMDVILRMTPILDGVALGRIGLDHHPDPSRHPGERRSEVFEQVMRRTSTGAVPYKYALRGRWFALQVEVDGLMTPGDLIVDQAVLEYDPVRPTQRTA